MNQLIKFERTEEFAPLPDGFSFVPLWNPSMGITTVPARPKAVADPFQISGYRDALERLMAASKKADELFRQIESHKQAIAKLQTERTTLVRRLQLGEEIAHGAASKLDRALFDVRSDVGLAEEALVGAEGDVQAARIGLHRVLRAAAGRYLAILRRASGEAAQRAAEANNVSAAWETWVGDVAVVLQHGNDLDDLVAMLGING